jgi:hypothetical protein
MVTVIAIVTVNTFGIGTAGIVTKRLSLGRTVTTTETETTTVARLLSTAIDHARTVEALDAAKNRPRGDADDLDTRRRNLMVTIASLEDRLDCIEKLRSREYGAQANLTVPRAHAARLH